MKKTLLLLALPFALMCAKSWASATNVKALNESRLLTIELTPLESAREEYENAKLALKNAATSSRAENARLQKLVIEKKEMYRLELEKELAIEKSKAKKSELEKQLIELTNANI
jgi:hypothetical protein